jgi:pimeloyl-ACP methyl ester carboxylesterase
VGLRQFVTERLRRPRPDAPAEHDAPSERSALSLAEDIAENPRTVTLRDGRSLGYAECGDPDGEPLLVCHGFPNSRVFGALFDAAGREYGFRIICPDRPGIGVSDPKPDRTLTDWPDDVADLFDALGVERTSVLGVSGGGPYATVTAALLGQRVDRLAVVCGVGPMSSVEFSERLWYYTARFAPPLSKLGMWSLVRRARKGPDSFLGSLAEEAGPPDDELWTGEVGRVIYESALESTRHHGLDPLVTDTAVYGSPWGFDLDRVAVPVGLWYARDDILVPPEMGLHLARELPTAEAHLYPDQDHLSIFEFNEDAIFSFLAGEG